MISQQKGERDYHIFYQLLSQGKPEYHERLLVVAEAGNYAFINQGELQIDGVDDAEEMLMTDAAYNILGFTPEEKFSYFKCIAAILNMGEMRFKQRPKEEQAEADGTSEAEKVAYLLGINSGDLVKAFLRPKIKVGSDVMQKAQTKEQVLYAVGAIAKSLYDRMFKWLVVRLNKTLDTKNKRQYFIGVLDIAGFEIFDVSSCPRGRATLANSLLFLRIFRLPVCSPLCKLAYLKYALSFDLIWTSSFSTPSRLRREFFQRLLDLLPLSTVR